ncbi:MAG: hypothetical protein WD490_09900 [Opitutales bacterium]
MISHQSGSGGAALSRRRYGETVEIINNAFPHWFCGNFDQYANNEDELPFDQHQLIALIAPRGVYVASADEDLWADPRGEFLSLVHASEVYALWGHETLDESAMPLLGEPLIVGPLGYHIREGGHSLNTGDWERYLEFAQRRWSR